MSAVGDLLPQNATPFEEAAAAGLSDVLPVPLQQIMDPATSPEAFLPWLAAHRSVDLWYSDWPLARKRQMIANAIRLARLKGTRQVVIDFLAYVDAQLVHAIAHPKRFAIGLSAIGKTPIGHKPFVARYLIKTVRHKPRMAFVIGRSAIGRAALRTPSREPLKRALAAIRVAKSPETEVRVDFAHKRLLTVDDAPSVDDGHTVDEFVDRFRL